jgi:signal transduction histidine kinase
MKEPMAKERWSEQFREALAEVEEQRDDTVVYLSAIKLVLEILARGHDPRQCGQEIAEALLAELAVETCAVALCDGAASELVLAGFSTQAQRLGGPGGGLGEAGWLALARLVRPGVQPTCFRRLPDGSFEAVPPVTLEGEGFLVLPFNVSGETGGALVLHSLAAPAQVFGRGRALALVAEIVGQAFTVARTRESVHGLCHQLEGELGVTRRALSDQQQSLRSQEENIRHLTQQLIRSNRVKREFLGTVSHELRTPLNAILGYSALLRDGMAGPMTDEQTTLLDRVLTNTQNLNVLIDDILFFVQLESDRVLVRKDRIMVRELIAEVMTTVPEPPGRDIGFRVEVDPAVTVLHMDASLLRRLLFHLLGNAFKFTVHGEVCVTVRPGEAQGSVVICVRDTGIGIAPERIGAMFELFSQGDGSTTRRYNGMGMGLTLVQRCVRLLGGEVAVDSRLQAGSEFRILVPGVLVSAVADEELLQAPSSGTVH